MAEPLIVPFGVEVSATTFASKLAIPAAVPHGPAGNQPLILYTPEVLESIRAICSASFVRDGAGAPIVGLLYGTRADDQISITAWVPAGELRNHNDAEYALKLQLRLASQRPDTADLTCVGWVRTRNHGEPRLVQEDEALHDRCFTEPGQTIMVVRPSFQRPTKAAFYQREPDGSFRYDRPVQEFFLYPAHEGDIEPPIAIPQPDPVETPAALVLPAPSRPSTVDLELLPRGTLRSFSPWIAGFLLTVGLLAGVGIASVRQARDAGPDSLKEPIRVVAESGRFAIRWSPKVAELPGVAGAMLSVTRDGHLKQIAIPLGSLRLAVAYIDWVSDDMEVSLRVDRPGYAETEQRIRIVGIQSAQSTAAPKTKSRP